MGYYMENKMNDFESFFVDCLMLAANDKSVPDGYIWDLSDCAVWQEKFNLGMSPDDAVKSVFSAN